jgi:3',5'-cyclic AMP phosphodiesterase CpdA
MTAEAPTVLAQLTDLHIQVGPGDGAAARATAAAVAAVRALSPAPHAVLVTGDVADHADDDEYARARELLERFGVPVHALPGNHDRRGPMRRGFGLPGAGDEPIRYAVDVGPLRLLALDSTIPDDDAGALGAEALGWLGGELAAAPEAPALVALHHPPLLTGRPGWDAFGLAPADRAGLGEVLARHAQVRRVLAGHLHRPMLGEHGGRDVLVAPSVHVQARLGLGQGEISFSEAEPKGYAVHVLADGELVSHFQLLPPA